MTFEEMKGPIPQIHLGEYGHDRGIRRSFVSAGAVSLAFAAGPAGALQILRAAQDTPLFYGVRFGLIGIALFVFLVSLLFRKFGYDGTVTWIGAPRLLILWAFCLSIVAGALLVNPESAIASLLQALGIILWVTLGAMIAGYTQSRVKALIAVLSGYLLSNLMYAVWAHITWALGLSTSFNEYNGRFVGPFTGSTATSDVLYSTMLLGILLLLHRNYFFGIALIADGLYAVFITGVRSASAVCVVAVALGLVSLLRTGRAQGARRLGLPTATILIIGIVGLAWFLFSNNEILQGRLQDNDAILASRDPIWIFALEAVQNTSPVFGAGVRAIFEYGISTRGLVYDSAISWHNTWLAVLVETGILGFVLFTAMLMDVTQSVFRSTWKWVRAPSSHSMVYLGIGLIAIRYLAMSLTEMNLYTALSPGVMFFFTLYGILVIDVKVIDRRLGARNHDLASSASALGPGALCV